MPVAAVIHVYIEEYRFRKDLSREQKDEIRERHSAGVPTMGQGG